MPWMGLLLLLLLLLLCEWGHRKRNWWLWVLITPSLRETKGGRIWLRATLLLLLLLLLLL